jgi:hypothetical protein
MPKPNSHSKKKTQYDEFVDSARALSADENEEKIQARAKENAPKPNELKKERT